MSEMQTIVAAPGTRLGKRQNLALWERGLSVAAGSAIGAVAARRRGPTGVVLGLLGSLLVARGISGAAPVKRLLGERPDERELADAAGWSSAALVARAVTINAPRDEVYRRFRDIGSWPHWAVNVERVDTQPDGSLRFVTRDPSGSVDWDATVTDELEGKLLALAAVPDSAMPITARYEFRDAVGGRGTEIHGVVAYQPPGGSLGRYAAKLTQREPGIQLRRDLKRFKSLIETGEIAVNDPQGSAPKS